VCSFHSYFGRRHSHAFISLCVASITLATGVPQYSAQQPLTTRDEDTSQDQGMLDDSKRKPGRPRGSRNRKPRASTSTSGKAPAGSQHPGFYQYPPAPGGSVPNQHFYDFQWRALNLCSEFYNAADELIVSIIVSCECIESSNCSLQKSASPVVIAQCYHSGPAVKVDPLALIAEAKRVCDTLVRFSESLWLPSFSLNLSLRTQAN
jgi:hypothetical protein